MTVDVPWPACIQPTYKALFTVGCPQTDVNFYETLAWGDSAESSENGAKTKTHCREQNTDRVIGDDAIEDLILCSEGGNIIPYIYIYIT